MVVRVVSDERPGFQAYYLRGTRSKTLLRKYVAQCAQSWVLAKHREGVRGAIMLDIDDTLIDGRETVSFGFEFMRELFTTLGVFYPIHIVTARPDDEHGKVMQMLMKRGFCIPPDRLHMLPSHLYGKSSSHVEDFKYNCFKRIWKRHGCVVLRMGDKMWDVSDLRCLREYRGSGERGDGNGDGSLRHVSDEDCYVFSDPKMAPCMSCKLPGVK